MTLDVYKLRRGYGRAIELVDGWVVEGVGDEPGGESAEAALRAAIARHEEAIPELEWLLDRVSHEEAIPELEWLLDHHFDGSILQEVRRELDEARSRLDQLRAHLHVCRVCGRRVNSSRWHADPWSSGGCCIDCEEKANKGQMPRTPVGDFPYWPGRTGGPLQDAQKFRRIAAVPMQGSISHIKIGAPNHIAPAGEVSVVCSQGPHHEHRGASKLATLVRLGASWREDVTPTVAEYVRVFNAWPSMSAVDRERHQGGVTMKLAEYPNTSGQDDLDAECLETFRPRQSIDAPDRDGLCFVGVSDRPRVISYRVADGEPVGHLNIRCGCGLEYRGREAKYTAVFDKLVAAGLDRIELRDLRLVT